mmetsp:Transcript_14604/g.26503  ORF Transcript_14604/g.26503 Transcript_14604/m.26503 type:complete len:248 (-) Transcript_14604:375-1118(-)
MEARTRRRLPAAQLLPPPHVGMLRHRSAAPLHVHTDHPLFGHGIPQPLQPRSAHHGPAPPVRPHGIRGGIHYVQAVQDVQGKELAEGHGVRRLRLPGHHLRTLRDHEHRRALPGEFRRRPSPHHVRPPLFVVRDLDAVGLLRRILWLQAGGDRVPRQYEQHPPSDPGSAVVHGIALHARRGGDPALWRVLCGVVLHSGIGVDGSVLLRLCLPSSCVCHPCHYGGRDYRPLQLLSALWRELPLVVAFL